MALVAGCFYIQPIQERDVNQPPQIIYPPGADLVPVPLHVYSSASYKPVVAANDPEGEILSFIWSVPRATYELPVTTSQTEAGDWQSDIEIPVEFLQDGESVEVTISDQAQPRNVVTVQWIVEVHQ